MSAGIIYSNIDAMNVKTGAFNDSLDIVSTLDSMALDLTTGSGNDVITVRSINGPTTIKTGAEADTVNVTPSSDGPVDSLFAPSTQTSAIKGLLTVVGGDEEAQSDVLNFISPYTALEHGRLTHDRVAGLQMPEGVVYQGWERLNIDLPIDSGVVFTIESTHAGRTELATGTGVDTINVLAIAGLTTVNAGLGADTINVGSTAPNSGGDVNAAYEAGGGVNVWQRPLPEDHAASARILSAALALPGCLAERRGLWGRPERLARAALLAQPGAAWRGRGRCAQRQDAITAGPEVVLRRRAVGHRTGIVERIGAHRAAD
jgi:hypothetical protein